MIWRNGGLGEELERSGRNGGELDWPSWFFTFQKKISSGDFSNWRARESLEVNQPKYLRVLVSV